MNYDDIQRRLKEIKIEDYIWFVYIGIIILSYYSNTLEKKYFLNNDLESKEKYRKILITVFTILVIVYSYFVKSAYDDIKNIKPTDSNEKKMLLYLSLLGSLLILISGIIFLYIAIKDQNINVEIAFN